MWVSFLLTRSRYADYTIRLVRRLSWSSAVKKNTYLQGNPPETARAHLH